MQNKQNVQTDNKVRFYVFQDDHFVDLNLYQCGWERCAPLHQFGPAVRNHFLFHYVLSGKGRLDTMEKIYHIEAGQGFLLCPDQISTYYADEEDPWEYTWLEFDGLRARECVTLAGLSENQPVYTPYKPNGGASMGQHMLHIVNHGDYELLRLVGHAMIFLDDLIQTSKTRIHAGNKKLRDFYMKEAMSFIEHKYREDISIEEIAEACGLNRSYFGRIFKETMGESPQQFLIHYRMTKAAELLKGSRISIGEVGASVGYENQLHFSRAFKSVFKMSPSEYRSRHYMMDL